MTPAQFKRKAEAMFKRANPGATVDYWQHGPVRVTWADGSKGISGVMYCNGNGHGYRSRMMVATEHNGEYEVR